MGRHLILLIIMVLVSGCILKPPDAVKSDSMTFEVTVPNNTPSGDTVFIYTQNQQGHRLENVGNFMFRITLNGTEIGVEDPYNKTVRYRYSRNGYDYHTAEYFEPDTNDYFWTEKGRLVAFRPGEVQRDRVGRWRWFPPEGVEIVRTSDITPSGVFLERVNGEEFHSGQVIEDLYVPAFYDFFNSTADHMREQGYGWAVIDPPQQWVEEDGLPRIRNLIEEAPNYPDDETLRDHIRAFKSRDLKVLMSPQVCCTEFTYESRSNEWWDVWFDEQERFLVHHARISEEEGVDAFMYAVGNEYIEEDAGERWVRIFRSIRDVFSGEVGEMVWNFGIEKETVIPEADYITWGNELDFFYLHADAPLSLSKNPTDEELKLGAGEVLDSSKQLYKKYGKPIMVQSTYFNVKETWRGASFYDISSVPWAGSEEKELDESVYEFGPEDQARVINAYFEAIADRPWVIGYVQFGYSHWENPLTPDLSVRGKPSEDVWRKWNAFIVKSS